MLTRRSVLALWLATLAALSSGSTVRSVSAGEPRTRLAVVVAKSSPINELSLAELKRLYLGDPVNAGGKKLIPLNRGPSSRERLGFDKTVLGMSAEEVARYWIDRKIRGQSGAPKTVDPGDMHERVVGRLEGSVGYAAAGEVNADVKAIRIDGKAPNDKGYPIEF